MYHNIPLELREWPQWVCWRYEQVNGRMTKVPYNASGQYKANIKKPETWGTFEQACNTAASATMDGIGFVFTNADPYTGIDIDDKAENPASEEELAVHRRLLTQFESWTERSVGARWYDAQGRERGGYHIIIRGQINGGRDRGHVGVYSTERYLTFSGDVVRNAPIAEYQQLLELLIEQMPDNSVQYELLDMEAVMTDREVHEMAMEAFNGAKYDKLCRGDLVYAAADARNHDYTSASEADLALISILGYYTRDNEQVRRLFRMSALGKREKHQGSNRWIDRCLKIFRSKQAPPTDLAAAQAAAEAMLANAKEDEAPAEYVDMSTGEIITLHTTPFTNAVTQPVVPTIGLGAVQVYEAPQPPAPVAPAPPARAHAHGAYSLPPGLVGELASYFYSTAVRPVQEAALVAAIGLVAGVVGRAYNISGTGLNQYMLFVATTGIGKEAVEDGISKMVTAARAIVPMAEDFVGPSAFGSGQGLIRVLDKRPCFVSVMGEFGLTLQALSDPRAPAASVLLRRVLLDLYGKSGWQNVLRETAYSDTEKNTKIVHAPSVTICGTATPETFWDIIDASDIADGLIPRFHIVEYKGQRVARNKAHGHPPSQPLTQRFADLLTVAITSKQNMTCSAIQMMPDAERLMDAFDEQCDEHMRGKVSAAEAQVWNRAHLKALKLAGVLAVGCNPHAPTVTLDLAQWAIEFVGRSSRAVLSRFQSGDVGHGEQKQAADLRHVIEDYFKYDEKVLQSYKARVDVQKAGIVPYSYLTVRTSRMASFSKDRNGAARALKAVIDNMVAAEQLGQLTPQEAQEKFRKREGLYYLGANW